MFFHYFVVGVVVSNDISDLNIINHRKWQTSVINTFGGIRSRSIPVILNKKNSEFLISSKFYLVKNNNLDHFTKNP